MKIYSIILSILFCILIQSTWADIGPKPRIVNGEISTGAQFSWQAALISSPLDPYQTYYCSGSIISNHWVATAAHCVNQIKKLNKESYVLVGTNDLQESQQGQFLKVKNIFINEFYDSQTFDNDIALLELEQDIDFLKCGKNCQSIGLIDPNLTNQYLAMSSVVQVSGWGILEDCDDNNSQICQQYYEKMIRNPLLYPTSLRYTTLKLTSCLANNSFYNTSQITGNMICAESPTSAQTTDTCFGDSGSGLVTQNNQGQSFLLGIASWGVGCAKTGYPGVYTRIDNYLTWINQHLQPTNNVVQTKSEVQKTSGGGSIGIYTLLVFAGLIFLRKNKFVFT